MTLYPCTKQPPCKNVSGHRTPVCPELTVKGSRCNTSASKLKADAMKNQTTKAEPNPNTRWVDNPQAVEIDALIERAGQLTVREAEALDAAYNAARYTGVAAYNAARCAAVDIATVTTAAAAYAAPAARYAAARYVAARYVAARYVAARYVAAIYAARHVADDAVTALTIRDLINEETPWNQSAYDILTAPWAKVIGKVHPDDVVTV